MRQCEGRLSFHARATALPATKTRRAYFPEAGGYVPCDVYQRASLPTGYRLEGPALIDEDETTTVLLPGDVCEVTSSGNLLVSIGVSDDEELGRASCRERVCQYV